MTANSTDSEYATAGSAPPDEFCCPISHELMRDPVIVCETGMSYDRETISTWLTSHDIDPSTGIDLGTKKALAPNVALRNAIQQWSDRQRAMQRGR
jgi:hypothetical protein